MNRFNLLIFLGVGFGCYKLYTERTMIMDGMVGKMFRHILPIPQSHIDAVYPPDPNPQNYGY